MTTWRMGVLHSLHSLALRSLLPLFLKFLVSGRSFQVRCDTTLSLHFDMVEEIPQVNILCVLLFSVGFISVVASIAPYVRCSMLVDDLALYISEAKLSRMERQLQLDVNGET